MPSIDTETLNELMDLQEDTASFFTSTHLISGQTYWTCVESLATTKLAELNNQLQYSSNQRFSC